MARFVFMNGVPSHRRRFMAGKLYAELLRILTEKVSRRGMPDDIPRTWILTRRDRALAPKVRADILTRSVVCRRSSRWMPVT
jgi:hypothetical protein